MIDLTRFIEGLNGRTVAVFGLGKSGLACVRALMAAGSVPLVWDDQEGAQKTAQDLGATVMPFESWPDTVAIVILAPGIPLTHPAPHPVVEWARARKIAVMGDIELLHRAGHGIKTIGVTGTNGKSTTTALIAHILNACGVHAAMGGNIGVPVMDLDIAGCAVLVLELSSYQLDLCPTFAPDIAVHLNLTPDHIDRHGSMDGYRAAKMRIFRGPGVAIIGIDDAESRKMAADVRAQGQRQVLTLSTLDAAADLVIQGGDIVVEGRAVGDMARAWALRGAHNHQNAAAALMAVREMGVGMGAAIAALETFPGLAHRMYKVAEIGGVSYINDSKATNADAASKALGSFETIYWILGGKPKEGGLAGLEGFLPRVRHGFTIGAADEMFAQWLEARGCAVTRCGTLEKAVAAAHKAAQAEKIAGAVVLLSPACASFDQFRSFEHRGDMFTQYVTRLGAGIKAEATG